MLKPVSLQILRINLVKLDCIIIYLDIDTIKKARNELDGACGLPLVSFCNTFFLFVPQNKIYMIRVKKQNVLYD